MNLHDVDKLVLIVVSVSCLLIYLQSRRRSAFPLPPGPKKLPLLGNLFDFPRGSEWRTFSRWSKEYNSDIIHISVAGSDLIILNSIDATIELLEKRSSIYSSRPRLTMLNELMGWSWLFSNMVYGEPWRERRKLFVKYFNPNTTQDHHLTQVEFIRKMLIRLLMAPDDALTVTRSTVGGIALSLAYGLPIKLQNDPYIKLAEDAVHTLGEAAVPGAFLVDTITALKYVPDWFPGAGFKKLAKTFYGLQERFRNDAFEATVQNFASGTAKPSFTSFCLEDMEGSPNKLHQIEVSKDVAAIVFSGGADTSLSAVHTMLLAMVNQPDVQAKAQKELDHVLSGRLPELSDEADLPYISALVKEVLRWEPVAPLAFPHLASEDDIYNGYHIPKDAIVVANSWAMLHDEQVYSDPSAFNPDRFLTKDGQLDPDVRDPSLMAFGYGRRICPGIHLAKSMVWLITATILSTFDILKSVDEKGEPIEAEIKYLDGVVHAPAPFKCTLKPRSSAAEALIRSSADSY